MSQRRRLSSPILQAFARVSLLSTFRSVSTLLNFEFNSTLCSTHSSHRSLSTSQISERLCLFARFRQIFQLNSILVHYFVFSTKKKFMEESCSRVLSRDYIYTYTHSVLSNWILIVLRLVNRCWVGGLKRMYVRICTSWNSTVFRLCFKCWRGHEQVRKSRMEKNFS